jgi:hypothetical protein
MNQLTETKNGQTLVAEYFKAGNSSGCKFYINGELVKEEKYERHNIDFAKQQGQAWLDSVETLNG